ncbi:hypothetical protein ACPY1K_004145 [Providencia stuartii]|uniref:hypothetical protein n=1 Tax=Providencia stuartii TaxID=588 RepID=UPI0024AC589F|nr:hypothetical protein [Providencia stuartii]MCR4081956.1 hypothetical protein [Providencia stuartii]
MILPELPEPKSKTDAITNAKIYATSINESDLLSELKEMRIKLEKENAPSWFIKIVDRELSRILFSLRALFEWKHPVDSSDRASEIVIRIYGVRDRMLAFLNPECLALIDSSLVDEWLDMDSERKPLRSQNERKQVKLSKLFRGDIFVGYTLSIDGQMLSNQLLVSISPSDGAVRPTVTVSFMCNEEMTKDAPDIHVK